MIRRIATLLGLFGLAALVCLAAAFTSGCGTPLTKGGFQQNLAHGLGPVHGRLEALDRRVSGIETAMAENKEVFDHNFSVIDGRFGRVETEIGQVSGKANLIVKKLEPIGRDASVASKEATSSRKAAEVASQKIVDAQKALGEKIDTTTATTVTAVADVGQKVDSAKTAADASYQALDQKVDRRADEVVGVVGNVDRKVDMTKVAAEAAASRAEAASAKAGADTVVEVGKVRKELSDHAVEAEKARQDILRLFNTLSPPSPATHP